MRLPQLNAGWQKSEREGHLERARLLEILGEHHDHIHTLLGEADAALIGIDPSRARVLALIRWQLMRRLRTYQLFKHTELFDPIIRGNDPERTRSAEAMKARCIAIGEAYNEHVGKWAAAGIESNWDAYKADTASIILAIRNHLARELAEAGKLLPEAGPRSLAVRGVGA